MTDLVPSDDEAGPPAPAEVLVPEIVASPREEALDGPAEVAYANDENLFLQLVLLGLRINLYVLRLGLTRSTRWLWKLRIFLAFAYLISPLDLIPEAVFGPLGLIDDAFLAVILADHLFNAPTEETFAHCWWGGRRVIDAVRRFARRCAALIPGLARSPVAGFFGRPDREETPDALPGD